MENNTLYTILLDNNSLSVFDTLETARLHFQSAKESFTGYLTETEIKLVDNNGIIHLTHNF